MLLVLVLVLFNSRKFLLLLLHERHWLPEALALEAIVKHSYKR